ncbi:MAG TPA: vanadium-dependent haloperoxidase [Verrucomicrobiae bacterium]
MKLLKLFLVLLTATLARADVVLDWNAVAVTHITAAGRPGPTGLLDYGVVHAAIHDAVQAYDKRFDTYASVIENATGSMDAAVAKAAHDVLTNRFPSQAAAIGTTYNNYLTSHGIAANDPGVAVGAEVAATMNELRADDGSFPATFPPNLGSNEIGMWRPTESFLPPPPASFSAFGFPWMADVTPFVVLDSQQFRANKPYTVKSGLYTKEYNETKALGSINSTERTPEQTQLAYFWAGNFLAQINDLVRSLADSELDNSGDIARLFALVYLTASDGLITTWAGKLEYPTWRPLTAIREGQNDGNKHTIGDPNWQPLINTPNYPDHSSGANGLMSGAMKMLSLFFGTDKMTFTISTTNPNANPKVHTYYRFRDPALEVVEARILQGIHFRTADRDGRKVGLNVARWVYQNALLPIGEQTDCGEEDSE